MMEHTRERGGGWSLSRRLRHLGRLGFLPKVHFFKLAQELGERPVELQKKLASEGITVRSTSTMLDDDTAERIREFHRKTATPTQSPVAPPPPEPPQPETPPVTPEVAPVTDPPVEPRPVTRVIKRVPSGQGAVTVTRPTPRPNTPPGGEPPRDGRPSPQGRDGQGGAPKRAGSYLTPESEGGLSPDAEFGIVKAAGTVPIPQPRTVRPRRPGEGRPGEGRPGEGRPGEGRPGEGGPRPPQREGGPARPGGPAAPGASPAGGPPKAAPGRTTDTKRKQKRTVFADKDREKGRTPARGTDFKSTVIRSRRKRREGQRAEAAGQVGFDEPIIITGPTTVRDLSDMVQALPTQIISQLIGMGVMATINQFIEPEQAVTVLERLGIEAIFQRDLIEHASWRLTSGGATNPSVGALRPPVVTILGHVDHGKTTLLDSIRKTNVTEREFGGITQHIGAYQVVVNNRKITFLDTPGHAAFTAMRARGANLTDIAVLVVAADDGIQPQTIEAIDHAKAAKVPIIVAVNKIDVPDAQPDVVKQQLTAYGIVAEEWGGDAIIVPLSAKKNLNIEQLLEMILLVADVQELRAETAAPARGAVIESKLDKQRGPVATVLVQEGTLRVGEALILGMVAGKIRAMTDDKGNQIKEAGPSTPVEIMGLSEVPVAGDLFETVADERKAREIAETRHLKARDERLQAHVSLQNLSSMVASGLVKDLNIIVKTDVGGSIEPINQALSQIEQSEIRVNIIHAGVGDVTESDVLLASASEAIIVGFHVRIEQQARQIAEEAGIDVRIYQVIYDLIDDVRNAMVGMLAPVFEEMVLGRAQVRATFKISRLGTIAGSYVTEGKLQRGAKVRILRGNEKVYEGTLDSLKHIKEDVRDIAQGFECGISLAHYNAWQEGDIIECYVIKELRRETL
jgi:translation initiation factor IF-2